MRDDHPRPQPRPSQPSQSTTVQQGSRDAVKGGANDGMKTAKTKGGTARIPLDPTT